jgi:hypothetical protein
MDTKKKGTGNAEIRWKDLNLIHREKIFTVEAITSSHNDRIVSEYSVSILYMSEKCFVARKQLKWWF